MRFTLVPWILDLYRNAIKKKVANIITQFLWELLLFLSQYFWDKIHVQEKLQNKIVKIPRNVYELVYILAEILGNLASWRIFPENSWAMNFSL